MQQAVPSLTQEVKDRLHAQGFKPYQPKPIPDLINPFSSVYWYVNALLGGVCLVGRHFAGKTGSVRILWSAAVLAIPIQAISAKVKLDSQRLSGNYRKSLEQRLDMYPLTRRAWQRALQTNTEYQNSLRLKIAQLEAQIGK